MHVAQIELEFPVPISFAFRPLAELFEARFLKPDRSLLLLLNHVLIFGVLRIKGITEVLEWFDVLLFLSRTLLARLPSICERLLLAKLLFLTAFGFDSAGHSENSALKLEVFLLLQRLVHVILVLVHNVANAFAEVRLGVSHEANVLELALNSKCCSQLLLADDERQIADEKRGGEVLPWIDSGIAATFGKFLVLALLLCQTLSTCVHAQVSVLEEDLVEFNLGLRAALLF